MPYWMDGNNLIGQPVEMSREDRRTRVAFLQTLGRFRRERGGRFTVFFDGEDPEGSASPPGVQVRYCAPRSADDEILYRLAGARTPSEVTVVTNDRALAARARSAGARLLTWQQFVSAMQRSPGAPARRAEPPGEKQIDVDEWSKYFGLDPGALD